MLHVGIDYGAKLAGTTVCCYVQDGSFRIEQSGKKQDADVFLQKLIKQLQPDYVFIDAPLSLPEAYRTLKPAATADFHYRKCDRETGAMSPMFLGGLTARAIRLASEWRSEHIQVFETYPSVLSKTLEFDDAYKKDLTKFSELTRPFLPEKSPILANWHQADALLAWLSGARYINNSHITFGAPEEGIIIV